MEMKCRQLALVPENMDREVGQAVKSGVNYGYRHIDCAATYGNESEIGEALSEVFKEGRPKREDLWITSKL